MAEKEGKKQRVIMGLHGNALVISLTDFVIDCGMFLTNVFWSLYVLELGASIADLGLFSLITGILPALLVAPIGYLGDRVSRKKLIIVGNFISSMGTLMNAFATSWVGLIPGTLLESLSPIIRPVRQSLIAEDIVPSERGKAFSTVFTLMMLPDTFMPPIAGVILDLVGLNLGMRYMLIISAALRFLVAFLRLKFLTEGKRTPRAKSEFSLSAASVRGTLVDMFRPLVSIKALQVMVVGSASSAFAMGMMMRYQSVFVVNVVGLTMTEWGVISAGVSLIRVLTRIPLGGLTDRWGRRKSILINYCLQPICIVAFAFSRDFLTIFLSMAARIIAFNFGGGAWEAMIVDVTPSEVRGSVYGSIGAVEMAARSISPFFGSVVWDSFSPEWVFHLTAIFRTFSAGVLYKFLKDPEIREE